MPLIPCYAQLNFHFSDLRSLLPRRDTYTEVISKTHYNCLQQHFNNKYSLKILKIHVLENNKFISNYNRMHSNIKYTCRPICSNISQSWLWIIKDIVGAVQFCYEHEQSSDMN